MVSSHHCPILITILVWLVRLSQGILYPQDSENREVKRLDGIWSFVADYEGDQGFSEKWEEGPLDKLKGSKEVMMMPVPSSYNDITQSKKLRDHVGWVWYSTQTFVPSRWKGQRVFLRFGSATHFAIVWVNGVKCMNHSGGYLPFESEVTSLLNYGKENLVVVALNNTLTPLTIPQGTLHYPNDTSRYPKGFVVQGYNFDYFNFAGIHRPVHLYATPQSYIRDVTVVTDFLGDEGRVYYDVKIKLAKQYENSVVEPSPLCVISIYEGEQPVSSVSEGCGGGVVSIPNVKLWWPYLSQPKGEFPGQLYTLQVKLRISDGTEDVYRLKFGVRTATVSEKGFFINGRRFYFHGFGRHEDYNIRGRGVDPVMLVKDHNLLRWVGANSYRTSHYPYAEEILDLTDRLGIVVIDESPAIGLTGYWNSLKISHIQVMRELVERDKNRPSVIMWSIGNEPKSMEKPAPKYFEDVIKATRSFDPSKRPITIVLSQNFSEGKCPESLDVVSINRYFGWYGDTGRTEVISLQIPTEVDLWYESYKRPVLITEYGAGSVAGMHQNPSFAWTEDFQVDYILQHFKAFDKMRQSKKKYFIGEMIWNFADFATPQETFRPWGCMKGIFTRERQPKAVAHLVRGRYWALANSTATLTPNVSCTIPHDLSFFYEIN